MSPVPRRVAATRCAALLAVAVLAVAPSAAHASSAASTSAYVTNGAVNAVVPDDAGRTYIGGEFTMVGPRTGSALALTTASDQPTAGFPDVSGGEVLAAVDDGAGGWFIGGSFTSVGGVARTRLAHVLADRTVDPTWAPAPSNTVRAMVRAGTSLYVGGDFGFNSSVPMSRLVKLSTTGAGAFDPAFVSDVAGARVRALALSGSSLYVGGEFGLIGGQPRNSLAKLSASTGAADATWDPSPNGPVRALALSGDVLYAGGDFFTIGGQSRQSVAKLSTSGTGAADATWDPTIGGPVYALAATDASVYVGGQFAAVGAPPVGRNGLAKFSASGTGAVDATWNPGSDGPVDVLTIAGDALYVGGYFGFIGGQERSGLARLPLTGTGAADGWNPNINQEAFAIVVSGNDVLAGGSFTSAGAKNVRRRFLARLASDGSLDTTWVPGAVNDKVTALALSGSSLYAGGYFTAGPGLPTFLARFSTASGAVDGGWTPSVDVPVSALAVSGDAVYAGKVFSLDAVVKFSTSGAGARDTDWDPDVMGQVGALALSGSSLFIGGFFGDGAVVGANRAGLAKLAATGTGAVDPDWNPSDVPGIKALLVADGAVYVGFTSVGTMGGTFASRLAKLSASGAGTAVAGFVGNVGGIVNALALNGSDLYIGGVFTSVSGQPHLRLARLSAATGEPDETFKPEPNGPVNALTAAPARVLAGGAFTSIGRFSAEGLGLFDFTPPSVTLTSPADGARYRVGQVVNAAYTCAGSEGETLSCTGTVPSGSAIDTATPGTKTFTATATDAGANSDSKTVSYVVDASAPTIQIGALPGGASYAIGEQAAVTYSCTDADGDTDVASCAGPVPSGGLLDTKAAGPHTFAVTASDRAGNTATSSVAYTVRPAPAAPADLTKPALTAVTLSPSAFRAERSGAPTGPATKRKPKRGTRVGFKLSEAATVTFTVIRPKKGKVKAKTLGRFTVNGKSGANGFVFRGRVGGKTLKAGGYQLTVQAADAATNKSALVRKAFKIKR